MADLLAGAQFGPYRIERILGEGGFATVFLAQDERPATNRRVALKVLDEKLAANAEFRARFTRESRLSSNLDHPNIVPVFEAGELEGRFFIAMRYVPGTDLKVRLTQSPMATPEVLDVVRQVAAALDAAHAEGLVHRDVKPANVLLADGHTDLVYLTDFGISKEAVGQGEMTRTGMFLGTLSYASPEQLDGRPLDGRSDQYALTCLLVEALTGRPPFEGTVQSVITAHATKVPPSVAAAVGLPSAVDAVIARGMAKEPADRFESCSALAAALAQAVGSGAAAPPVEDLGATLVTRAPAPPAPGSPAPPLPPPPGVTVVDPIPAPAPAPVATRVAPPTAGRAGIVALAAVVTAAVLAGIAAVVLVVASRSGDGAGEDFTAVTGGGGTVSSAPATEDSGFTGPTAVISPTRVAAPLAAAPGIDACRTPTDYEGDNLFDGDPETAWRTEGDGLGRRVTVNLGEETLVTSVGLINGMAKIDPCDGTDRYLDQRRITRVRWSFDDGTEAVQDLDPSDRGLQTIQIESITTRVGLEILATTAPGTRDFTPISEMQVQGVRGD